MRYRGFVPSSQSKQRTEGFVSFLWWEDGDATKDPQEYRITVHLFGATSSLGCANFAL